VSASPEPSATPDPSRPPEAAQSPGSAPSTEQAESPQSPAPVDAGPKAPATGDQPVDEAVEALQGVLQRPLGEQVLVYGDVHGRLQDRLADLDG
jgi:hypothetical protein